VAAEIGYEGSLHGIARGLLHVVDAGINQHHLRDTVVEAVAEIRTSTIHATVKLFENRIQSMLTCLGGSRMLSPKIQELADCLAKHYKQHEDNPKNFCAMVRRVLVEQLAHPFSLTYVCFFLSLFCACDLTTKPPQVFVQTREAARRLTELLVTVPEVQEFVRPAALIGHGKGHGTVGMSTKQQTATVQRFVGGETNVLIATSLAHEGLDAKACNLVVMLSKIDSGKVLTQTKGRASRASGGHYHVVFYHGGAEHRGFLGGKQQESNLQKVAEQRRSGSQLVSHSSGAPAKNAVMELHEYAQKNGGSAEFTEQAAGAGFECTCTFTTKEGTKKATGKEQTKKKAAKTSAAEAMLELLSTSQ
jgi:hypothetical protein